MDRTSLWNLEQRSKLLRDRFRRHDAGTLRSLLEEAGASSAEAAEITESLITRLTPRQAHEWLTHPERCHPVEDDEQVLGVNMVWTPINAVESGKTHLVVDEARRFASGA